MTRIEKLRETFLSGLKSMDFLPLGFARVIVGWVFLESGWGKLHNLPKVIEFFTQLQIPAPHLQAPFVAFTEFSCGILVLAGLLTRLAAMPLSVTMIVALLTAKRDEIHSVSDLFGISEFLYIPILLFLIFYGAGPLSVDGLVRNRTAYRLPK